MCTAISQESQGNLSILHHLWVANSLSKALRSAPTSAKFSCPPHNHLSASWGWVAYEVRGLSGLAFDENNDSHVLSLWDSYLGTVCGIPEDQARTNIALESCWDSVGLP